MRTRKMYVKYFKTMRNKIRPVHGQKHAAFRQKHAAFSNSLDFLMSAIRMFLNGAKANKMIIGNCFLSGDSESRGEAQAPRETGARAGGPRPEAAGARGPGIESGRRAAKRPLRRPGRGAHAGSLTANDARYFITIVVVIGPCLQRSG